MTIGWIVAISKPARESYAAENLSRLDAEFYFPKIVERVMRGPRDHRQLIERASPLFPRYIFVHIHDQWRFLLNVYGLSGIMMRGEEPQFAAQAVIDQIMARQDEEGIVQLPHRAPQPLSHGDKVKVTGGQFEGYHGIYQGMAAKDRQKVLLDVLGRKTPVLIAKAMLQAA